MQQIPVYYHIPKCGGTYILSLYSYLNKENERKIRKRLDTNCICRLIDVYLNETRYIQMTGIMEIKDLMSLNCNIESYNNIFSLDQLYQIIDEDQIKITSIFIQPTGDGNMLDSRNQVDKIISYINKQPIYFTIIRDIFQRLYSEYSYLTSSAADHEPSNNLYKSYANFEDFLIKSNNYDNIITKQVAYNMPLDNTAFKMVENFFSNFVIGTMQSLEATATNVWKQCYGWAANGENETFLKNENRNKLKINIDNISYQAKQQFLSNTQWDRKLYAYLSQL
jgi:hypothetical protein